MSVHFVQGILDLARVGIQLEATVIGSRYINQTAR